MRYGHVLPTPASRQELQYAILLWIVGPGILWLIVFLAPPGGLRRYVLKPALFAWLVWASIIAIASSICVSAWLLVGTELFLARSIDTDLKRVNGKGISKPWSWTRAYEGLSLLHINPRAIGWNIVAVPWLVDDKLSRSQFVLRRSFRLAIGLILHDLAAIYNRSVLFRHGEAWQGIGFLETAVLSATIPAALYIEMSNIHETLGILCVLMQISKPKDWPVLFGGWQDFATIKLFWGRGLHQLLRRPFSGIGKAAQPYFSGVEPYYVSLWTAFITSGIFHAIISWQQTGTFARTLLAFVLQPVAIIVEERVKLGVLHRLFVLAWLAFSSNWIVFAGNVMYLDDQPRILKQIGRS